MKMFDEDDPFFQELYKKNIAGDHNNKRLHLYFNHCGLLMFSPQDKSAMEALLRSVVWNQFGTVTDTFYHDEFSYGFVSFQTKAMASSALAGFLDNARVRNAIDMVIAAQTNDKAKAAASLRLNEVFVTDRRSLSRAAGALMIPSWATSRG